jgi:hypothetical protein
MKIIFIAVLVCSSLLQAQDHFFVYGKVLDADGMPLPSAQVSLSTVIEQRPITSAQVGSDGSFKLLVSGHAIALMTFTGAASDSFTLPLLLTTEQHTLNLTVRLARCSVQHAGLSAQHASIQIQYGNTELGIAEKLMASMMEEKRLAGLLTSAPVDGKPPASHADSVVVESGIHYPQPDSVLTRLSEQIRAEENPLHREAFLLRYMQLRTETKRMGDPAIVNMVLSSVDPESPFWSLVPELIKASASTSREYKEYALRVKALTLDPELKTWLETHL